MMQTVFEKRAATVLFRFLTSNRRAGAYLLPANVCPIVPVVFHKAGVPFELLDIDPNTLALDLNLVLQRIRHGTCAGILYVRTYGAVFNVECAFKTLKDFDPSLLIIDDRCLAMPKFSHSGGYADLELYSSGYSKYVDLGWGGWGHLARGISYMPSVTPFFEKAHEDLIEQFRRVKDEMGHFEYRDSDWLDCREFELPRHEFESLVLAQMTIASAHRAKLNAIYRSILPQEQCLPEAFSDWRFHVWVADPEALLKTLFAAGLFASSHYASLVPSFGAGHVPKSQLLESRIVNLFNDFRFDYEMPKLAASITAKFLNQTRHEPYPWNDATS